MRYNFRLGRRNQLLRKAVIRTVAIATSICLYLWLSQGNNDKSSDVIIEKYENVKYEKNFLNESNISTTKRVKICNFGKRSNSVPQLNFVVPQFDGPECSMETKEWYLLDGSILSYTDYAFDTVDLTLAVCAVSPFTRKTDTTVHWGEKIPIESSNTSLTGSDFYLVNCKGPEQSYRKTLYWRHMFLKLSLISVLETLEQRPNALSVYWLSISSLSQAAFRQFFPKTVAYLENIMDSHVLSGYDIGASLESSLLPSLTGKTLSELESDYNATSGIDAYPFIWNDFKNASYVTMFAENSAKNAELKGFKDQPTDHYPQSFFQLGEQFFHNIECIGTSTQFRVMTDYSADFFTAYPKTSPKFSVLRYAHPSSLTSSTVAMIDDVTVTHLKQLHENGHFDNTIVFISADYHQMGLPKERMPFLSVYLPTEFRDTIDGKRAHINLLANKNVPVTPFDIHATFTDILKIQNDEQILSKSNSNGISLFQPIRIDRFCE